MTTLPTADVPRQRRASSATPKRGADGRWHVWLTTGRTADGKRRQVHLQAATKRQLTDKVDEVRGAVRTGRYSPPQRQTLADYLTVDWLPVKRRELAESTWEGYARNIRVHIVPALGSELVDRVDAGMLDRFYTDLLSAGRLRGQQSAGLKPKTVRHIHAILSGAFDDAVKARRCPDNPCRNATPPAARMAKSPEMRTWTGPQVRRFLELCEGDWYYPAFYFLAATGCRRGEALGLRWSDIDMERRSFAVVQSVIPLTKASGTGREARVLPSTKSGKPRVVEMDAATVAMLRRWRSAQAEARLGFGPGYADHRLVFCRPDGLPHHPEAFSKTFDRRLRQPAFAELPTIRLHDLRHSWATLALRAGVDVTIVARRLGHSVQVCQATYQHVTTGMQAGAAELVAALIFGS
jgi:integrase